MLKATLATDAVIGAVISPKQLGSAYVLTHHVMGEAAGRKVGKHLYPNITLRFCATRDYYEIIKFHVKPNALEFEHWVCLFASRCALHYGRASGPT